MMCSQYISLKTIAKDEKMMQDSKDGKDTQNNTSSDDQHGNNNKSDDACALHSSHIAWPNWKINAHTKWSSLPEADAAW